MIYLYHVYKYVNIQLCVPSIKNEEEREEVERDRERDRGKVGELGRFRSNSHLTYKTPHSPLASNNSSLTLPTYTVTPRGGLSSSARLHVPEMPLCLEGLALTLGG